MEKEQEPNREPGVRVCPHCTANCVRLTAIPIKHLGSLCPLEGLKERTHHPGEEGRKN